MANGKKVVIFFPKQPRFKKENKILGKKFILLQVFQAMLEAL